MKNIIWSVLSLIPLDVVFAVLTIIIITNLDISVYQILHHTYTYNQNHIYVAIQQHFTTGSTLLVSQKGIIYSPSPFPGQYSTGKSSMIRYLIRQVIKTKQLSQWHNVGPTAHMEISTFHPHDENPSTGLSWHAGWAGTHNRQVFSVMRRYRTNVSQSVSESLTLLNRLDWCDPGGWRYLLRTLLM